MTQKQTVNKKQDRKVRQPKDNIQKDATFDIRLIDVG